MGRSRPPRCAPGGGGRCHRSGRPGRNHGLGLLFIATLPDQIVWITYSGSVSPQKKSSGHVEQYRSRQPYIDPRYSVPFSNAVLSKPLGRIRGVGAVKEDDGARKDQTLTLRPVQLCDVIMTSLLHRCPEVRGGGFHAGVTLIRKAARIFFLLVSSFTARMRCPDNRREIDVARRDLRSIRPRKAGGPVLVGNSHITQRGPPRWARIPSCRGVGHQTSRGGTETRLDEQLFRSTCMPSARAYKTTERTLPGCTSTPVKYQTAADHDDHLLSGPSSFNACDSRSRRYLCSSSAKQFPPLCFAMCVFIISTCAKMQAARPGFGCRCVGFY